MAIRTYLAMTAAEFKTSTHLPESVAWMACHFSPYGTGLSNIPRTLPENSLLIVNDITPIQNHNPEIIAMELIDCIEALHCSGVLLDFQRLPNPKLYTLSEHLMRALPRPPILPEPFAGQFNCPVFLPPCPLCKPLQEHIQNWKDREIWLEIAKNETSIVISKEGTFYTSETKSNHNAHVFPDSILDCHYTIQTNPHEANFHLWRTEDDTKEFLYKAEKLGIHNVVGLYQEYQNNV